MMLAACALNVLIVSQLPASAPLPKMAASLSEADAALAVLALEGLHEGRERVLSAVLEVGSPSTAEETGGEPLLYLAFDRAKGRTRFDNRADPLTQVIWTPNETLVHVLGGDLVGCYPPGYNVALKAARPVEARLLGLITIG